MRTHSNKHKRETSAGRRASEPRRKFRSTMQGEVSDSGLSSVRAYGQALRVHTLRSSSGGRIRRRLLKPASAVSGGRNLHFLLEGRGRIPMLVVTDALAALVAVVAAALIAVGGLSVFAADPWLLALPAALVGVLHVRGQYRGSLQIGILDSIGPLGGAISVVAMLFFGPEALLTGDASSAPLIAHVWVLCIGTVLLSRTTIGQVSRFARARNMVGKPTLIVGAGVVGERIAKRLEDKPQLGLRPIGFLDADPVAGHDETEGRRPVLGAPEDVADVAAATGAEHVIFAFTRSPDRGLIPLARRCEELGLEVSLVPRFFESINDRVRLERIESLPLFSLRAVDPKGWQFDLKYGLDRAFALVLLVMALPLLAVLALAVRVSSPGPVLFRQRRVGRDGQHFDLLKFRSMRVEPVAKPFEVRDGMAPGGVEGADRRTRVGRFLRKTSLDELPQLVNVLKGEMSLVGPRPERPEFVESFGRHVDRYTDRHRVKSGITGWAQVNGLRGQTSLHDRIDLDNFYIENWSLWFDLKIMLLTGGALIQTGEDT